MTNIDCIEDMNAEEKRVLVASLKNILKKPSRFRRVGLCAYLKSDVRHRLPEGYLRNIDMHAIVGIIMENELSFGPGEYIDTKRKWTPKRRNLAKLLLEKAGGSL